MPGTKCNPVPVTFLPIDKDGLILYGNREGFLPRQHVDETGVGERKRKAF
jgi:hypothetical protein